MSDDLQKLNPIKICYFPGRESGYSRNRVLIKGMREAGIIVHDCSSASKSFLRYISSFLKFLYFKNNCDFIFVGFLGQFLVPIIKVFTRKKILFDAFISIYQTMCFDRQIFSPNSLKGKLAKWIDQKSCADADIIFLDTDQHIQYFINTLDIDKDKLHKLPVGSDDSIFYPRESTNKKEFIVHFHGEFQPLHGTPYIVEAAKILPNIKFQMIGKGTELLKCKELTKKYQLSNIEFKTPVAYEKLPKYMSQASVCLGIFGDTEKAKLVIPHKVYEALAMGIPIITAEAEATRESLTDKLNSILCQPADPVRLAEAILFAKNNKDLAITIGKNGYNLFKENYTQKKIGETVHRTVADLIAPSS